MEIRPRPELVSINESWYFSDQRPDDFETPINRASGTQNSSGRTGLCGNHSGYQVRYPCWNDSENLSKSNNRKCFCSSVGLLSIFQLFIFCCPWFPFDIGTPKLNLLGTVTHPTWTRPEELPDCEKERPLYDWMLNLFRSSPFAGPTLLTPAAFQAFIYNDFKLVLYPHCPYSPCSRTHAFPPFAPPIN